MPARPAIAPGARPGGIRWLVCLVALPQGEVTRVALGARVGVGRRLHVLGLLASELAVGRPARRVEVDVARAIRRRVGVPCLDEALDDRLHLGDARGGAGLVGGGLDAQRGVAGRELELVPVGVRPPCFVSRGGRQDLVVDVGDVAHERHVVAAVVEPAPPQVVDERRAQVADVGTRLHGGSAEVHADLACHERHEVDEALGLRVIEADCHWASLPGRRGR